ncbi:MAG: DegQ family serine endoprotease [Burkholderiaceae bacterium]|nr:DegQ family serine endoprotease [Sulfuritalea sp.]MCF8174554.1 DegQ family serine endoprotease [Burkholderiaceae bacterium]MCF8184879.1 DegQ family serine endoprotease [Polynucleobacter sp.]
MKRILVALVVALSTLISFQSQARDLPDFTELVEQQGAAVVNISTTQVIKGRRGGHAFPFDGDDAAQELLRRFFPGQIPNIPGVPQEFKNRSLGSGFIVSAEGHILTNAHVVDGADEVLVKLSDKREFKAKVLGADKRSDVALIKIDASKLQVAKLGDSTKIKVGEWVVAIGSPFGFENTVTAGIVSATGRSLTHENYVPFIQTDVAINPGNSGGPLFNMKGEVIGINSQIYSRSGGSMGLSFAIPIDLAMDIQSQLKDKGKVSRGRLGIGIQEVSKELAESFKLAKPQGALVASVEKGTAADKAGIEIGDIILKFDGKAVSESSDLPRMVGSTRPGTKVLVQVWRNGGSRDLSVTVGAIPDDEEAPRSNGPGQKPNEAAAANRLGLVLTPPTAEQKRVLGIRHGLIVEEVRNAGTRTELRSGDIILSLINKGSQTDVKSVQQFNDLLQSVDKSATITLLVRRGNSQTFVTIKGLADK